MDAQGVCTDCDQPVIRLFTVGGKLRDLDPTPVDDGNHLIVTLGDGRIRARTLSAFELPHPGPAHRVHQCPARERATIGCANPACRYPLDRALAEAERWSYHPTCEPEFLEQLRSAYQRVATGRRPRR